MDSLYFGCYDFVMVRDDLESAIKYDREPNRAVTLLGRLAHAECESSNLVG